MVRARVGWGLILLGVLLVVPACKDDEAAIAKQVAELERAAGPARQQLIDAIAARGAAAVPALERGLMHWSGSHRQACAVVLGRIGPAATSARASLVEGLLDDAPGVRGACLLALARTSSWDARLAATLNAHAASEKDPSVRRAALHALALLGPGSAAVLRLRLMEPAEREDVIQSIGTWGEEGLPVLESLLEDASWHVRSWVVRGMASVEPLPDRFLPVLLRVLEDESSAVRYESARWLSHRSGKDARVAPLLAPHLANADAMVRRVVSLVLATSEVPPEDAGVALVAALADEDVNVRTNAGWALGQSKDGSPAAVEALQKALQDPEASVRLSAARSLARFGRAEPQVLATLTAAAGRYGMPTPFTIHHRDLGGGRKRFDDWRVSQDSAVKDLVALGDQAVPALAAELKRADGVHAKRQIAYTLGHLGPAAAPALEALLAETDEGLALSAACCLARLGERGAKALPVLMRTLWTHGPEVIISGTAGPDEVSDALLAIGPPAIPALEEGIRRSESNAWWAEQILEQIRKQQAEK